MSDPDISKEEMTPSPKEAVQLEVHFPSNSGNATDALLLEPPPSDELGAQPKRTNKVADTTTSSDNV